MLGQSVDFCVGRSHFGWGSFLIVVIDLFKTSWLVLYLREKSFPSPLSQHIHHRLLLQQIHGIAQLFSLLRQRPKSIRPFSFRIVKVGFAWRPDPTALRLVLSHQNTRSLLSVPLEMLPILPTDIINRYLFIHGHGGLTDPLCTFLLCILIELMPDVKRFCKHSFAKLSCLLLV